MGSSAAAEPRDLRAQKKAQTRSALRQTGLTLFRTVGFEHTTAEEIARVAGTSLRTFFRYFRCKEAILFDTERLPDILDGIERPPPGESLTATLRRIGVEFFEATSPRQRTLRNKLMARNPSIRLYLYQLMAEIEPMVTTSVSRRLGVDSGADPRAMVFAQLFCALACASAQPSSGHEFIDTWLDSARAIFDELC